MKIERKPYTKDEWIKIKYPKNTEYYLEWMEIERVAKEMPFYAMKQIPDEKVWTSKMFSKEGWKRVHEACGNIRYYGHPSDELSDGFTDFIIIWLEDNEFDIEPENPIITKNRKDIFWMEDDYLYYFDGDLHKALLDRYVDYLQGD